MKELITPSEALASPPATPSVPPSEAEPRPGLVRRVLGVFVSPGRTFEAIAARPDWVAPLLLTAVVTGVVGVALYKPVIVPAQLDRIESRDIPPEQMDQIEARIQSPAAQAAGVAMPVIVLGVILVIQAGLLLFLGSIVLGGESSFRRVFAVVAYASLVYTLGVVVQAPIHLWVTRTPDPVAGLGFLAPSDAGSAGVRFAHGILASIDVFALWQTALLAVGLSKAYRRAPSFGLTCAAVLWVLGALVAGGVSILIGAVRA